MNNKKRSIVEWAMHYRQMVLLVACCLIAFGIYGLGEMNKNEFPDFTVRQGVVVVVAPGLSAEDVEQQIARTLEDYVFSYKEVKKEKTQSYSRDGLFILQVELNDDVDNKDEFWSKFKHGISAFKTQLPSSVLAVQVQDDFGDTSSMLITLESRDKTYRELKTYIDVLKDSLRTIESVGRLSVYGLQKEQISVYLDNDRLSHYGIGFKSVALQLFNKGFVTTAGTQRSADRNTPIYVSRSLNMANDVEQLIVYADPQGNVVRLKDVARVVREYPAPTSFITNNGRKCLVLSVEMKSGRNITRMGEAIDAKLAGFEQGLPDDVSVFRITDQSKVVGDSITNFLHELLIAIAAVVLVVVLLLPLRVALVAASTIPVSIFISLGLFYVFGIELNTVTLAALIVTLGMIVDNSIVIIDSYLELLREGHSRWGASIRSAEHFFPSILSATLAISITFFPFVFTFKGMNHDFIITFPWAISIVLFVSLLVAALMVPFLQFYFIRIGPKPTSAPRKKKKERFNLLNSMQRTYDYLLDRCFAHPYLTCLCGVAAVGVGFLLMVRLPQRLMPTADRNQLAVEIYLPSGSSLDKTTAVADSLERLLKKDARIVSIASFKGMSSPRFHTAYAPQFAGTEFAQFVINTTGNKATESLIADYRDRYADYFPEAYVRFKQLSYGSEANPIEIRLSGNDLATLNRTADSLMAVLRDHPDLLLVRDNRGVPLPATRITLHEDEAGRLGIGNATVETALALGYNRDGLPIGTVWNGDYDVSVRLKGTHADRATTADVADEQLPALGGLATVPLRQVAEVQTVWQPAQICHRNGLRTITLMAEVKTGLNVLKTTADVQQRLAKVALPEGVSLSYGGEWAENAETQPQIVAGLSIAVAIIFFILLIHFKRISTSLLLLVSLALVLPGAALGAMAAGVDWGLTCTLGIISLMGILVRNAIIMYDYAEELRQDEKLSAHEAILTSAKRRMRPIFLTSAAASMGVVPMIAGGSGLWMPMGAVIGVGTLVTMVLILLLLPVAYWLMMSGTTRRRQRSEQLENE